MSRSGRLAALAPVRLVRAAAGGLLRRVDADVGGTVRLRVVALFACVLMLNAADQGTTGAIAPQLEAALHISNTQLGLIASVSALAGAAGTLPVGLLTDRVHRINLLAGSIVLWSAAMLASAFAPSFTVLVLTRLMLGGVMATSGPTLASLIGDFFPARERAKVWGMILTGELVGSGIGVVASGDLASILSWRFGYGWLALPGLMLAAAIRTLLVEPARGGQSRLEPGAEELLDAETAAERASGPRSPGRPEESLEQEQELAQAVIEEQGHRPYEELVLHEDPVRMPLWRAVRYVFKVRTNVVIVIASALAYLFFAGVQTFAVELMRSRFGLGQAVASGLLLVVGVGALAGVVLAGRIADRLLRHGRPGARVAVGAIGYIIATAVFVPALLSPWLLVSMPLFVIGGAGLAAPDSPLNAARLDIMHPRLWGRAEGVRTFLQMLAFAVAPLIFGFVSGRLGGPSGSGGEYATSTANGGALAHTFLIMLIPLGIGGLILLRARRSYPCDVATAIASVQATAAQQPDPAKRHTAQTR